MELNYKPLSASSQSLVPYLGQSAFWHVALALAFFIIPLTLKKLNIISGDQNVVLAKSSVRVDVVAMPTMTIKELRNLDQSVPKDEIKGEAQAKVAEVEAPPAKDEAAFLKQQEKKSFMDMIKNYKDKDIPKKAKGKESTKAAGSEKGKNAGSEKINELIYMGNKISKGSALVGTVSDVELTELENYASLIPTHVKPYWRLPSYLMDKSRQCRIQVFLSRDGKVLNTRVHTSSGDIEYDQKAIDAIVAAEPFPTVPDAIAAIVMQGKILLGFPL